MRTDLSRNTRLRIVSIRKNTDPAVKALEDGFLARLKKPFVLELHDIRRSYAESAVASQVLGEEAKLFEARIAPKAFRVALDETAATLSSARFAEWLRSRLEDPSSRGTAFLIGGAFGLPEQIKKSASFRLSLSPMTFSHELARLLLIEQIYRAQEILRGGKYHR